MKNIIERIKDMMWSLLMFPVIMILIALVGSQMRKDEEERNG